MILERSLRLAIKHFGTLFLLVAIVTLPLHVAYSFFFRNVIAVSELHDQIETFPENRQVQGVGTGDLDAARFALLGITLAEIALIPVLARAAARVVTVDEEQGVPTVPDALSHLRGTHLSLAHVLGGRRLQPVLAALLVAAALGILLELAGMTLIEPLSDEDTFAGVGLVQGVARAAAAPFLLMGLAVAAQNAKAPTTETPTLY